MQPVHSKERPKGLLHSIGRLFAPTHSETSLLRACVGRGEAARAAFQGWSQPAERAIEQLQANGGSRRRLICLLQAALERESMRAPAQMQALFRAATLYEELRTRAYREIAHDVLAQLIRARVPFLATRGVCFGASLYGEEELRHCHDIDLLVPEAELAMAAEVLVRECGFRLASEGPANRLLYHSSGLPLALHATAIQVSALTLPWNALWGAKVKLSAYSMEFETLSPEHSLLQVILHGSTGPQRRSLLWICDAHKLIGGTLDWRLALEPIQGGLETLTVLLALEYMARELQAPVPESVRASLQMRWDALSYAERRCARETLLLLLQRTEGARAMLRRTEGLFHRASLLRAMIFPSPRALCALQEVDSRWGVPWFWARRVGRGLGGTWLRRRNSSL